MVKMSPLVFSFSVDFQKHFCLANLLQHTDFQNILKTVAPIYIFWWHVLDCVSIIYKLIEICQRTICADSGKGGGVTSK